MDQPPPWQPPDPSPISVRTPRLVLRAFGHADAASLFEAIESSRAALEPWITWGRQGYRSLGETHYEIERLTRLWDAKAFEPGIGYIVAIIDAGTGAVLGGTGLHRFDVAAHEGELGYWVRGDRHGQGIASEAAAHMLSWAFTPQHEGGFGLRRVTVYAADPNGASGRVLAKLGLACEGVRRAHRWVEGLGWTDTRCWAVLRDEWDRERHRVLTPA